jgi:hypothetical protein
MNRIKHSSAFLALYRTSAVMVTLSWANVAYAAEEQYATKPAWPDNGIAQRMLPGAYNMFVEKDDHGQWHAWIMNGDGEDAQALDFFSGKQMHVKASLQDNGQQSRFFVDPSGGVHGPLDKGFEFELGGASGLPGGVYFAGGSLSLSGTNCSASFVGIKGGISDDDPMKEHPKWNKVPIYHIAPSQGGCPSGKLDAGVNTALDLQDGTFLITEGCWIFRLRKSDLSPVGAASGLRVVDKETLLAVIDQAKGKDTQDASAYLAKALNLSFDGANSCKLAS